MNMLSKSPDKSTNGVHKHACKNDFLQVELTNVFTRSISCKRFHFTYGQDQPPNILNAMAAYGPQKNYGQMLPKVGVAGKNNS